jgi:hypothetical protein
MQQARLQRATPHPEAIVSRTAVSPRARSASVPLDIDQQQHTTQTNEQ